MSRYKLFSLGKSANKIIALSVLLLALATCVGIVTSRELVFKKSQARCLGGASGTEDVDCGEESGYTVGGKEYKEREGVTSGNKALYKTIPVTSSESPPPGVEYCDGESNACFCTQDNCYFNDIEGETFGCERGTTGCDPESLGAGASLSGVKNSMIQTDFEEQGSCKTGGVCLPGNFFKVPEFQPGVVFPPGWQPPVGGGGSGGDGGCPGCGGGGGNPQAGLETSQVETFSITDPASFISYLKTKFPFTLWSTIIRWVLEGM